MKPSRDRDATEASLNPGYAASHLARALRGRELATDDASRERAARRVERWHAVLQHLLDGSLAYGINAPVAGVPPWVTLEVVTGGFATGALSAGGPLDDDERRLLAELPPVPAGRERAALNADFLSEAGLARLADLLASGCYAISVPEEGALLVAAWLSAHGRADDVHALLDELVPFFDRLRFYPCPAERPIADGASVHLATTGEVLARLRAIPPQRRIEAQREAVRVWVPLHDQVVALFRETVEDGWPCRRYPPDWVERSRAVLAACAAARAQHTLCGRTAKPKEHRFQLRELLERCVADPASLTGRDVGRVRHILACHLAAHGEPGSAAHSDQRARQLADVQGPTHTEIASVVTRRLAGAASDDGLADPLRFCVPVDDHEAIVGVVPSGVVIPERLRRIVARARSASVAELVRHGVLTSGDLLAVVLPQWTAGIRAAGFHDADLRRLHAAIDRAFCRRRSLLLLNLERQVEFESLPWVRAIAPLRAAGGSAADVARQALEEVVRLALTAFPHALLPNKLVRELRSLSAAAGLELPWIEELAADIFMGRFSSKFVAALRVAAGLLDGTLYARYFDIDYPAIVAALHEPLLGRLLRRPARGGVRLGELCAARAGVEIGTWRPATNGMIVEQQQVLTTQNLATAVAGLGLRRGLGDEAAALALRCFRQVCASLQRRSSNAHGRLIQVKQAAYAWRQMVFFAALLPREQLAGLGAALDGELAERPEAFRERFAPALRGLQEVIDAPERRHAAVASPAVVRPFVGWSDTGHWLLADPGRGVPPR